MKIFWLGVHLHFGNIRLRFLFILWTYSHTESLSDILVGSTGSIQVSHPIYISVVCFATWLIVSCYKHLEPNPVLSLIPLLGNHFLLGPSLHLVLCAFRTECFSPTPSPRWLFADPLCFSNVGGRSGSGLQSCFSYLTAVLPLVAACLFLWIHPIGKHAGLGQWKRNSVDTAFFFFSFPSVLRKGSMGNGEIIIPAAMKQ